MEIILNINTSQTITLNARVKHDSVVTEQNLRRYIDTNLVFIHKTRKINLIDTMSNIAMARDIASAILNDCSCLSSSEIRGAIYNMINLARGKAEEAYNDQIIDGKLLNRVREIVANKAQKYEQSDVHESAGACIRAMKDLTWKLNHNKIVKEIPAELEEHLFKLLTLYYSETEMIDKWKMMHIVSVINT